MTRAQHGVIFFFLGVIAAALGWFAFNGECKNGTVFESEAACRAAAGFDAAFCRDSFRKAHVKATVDYAPYRTQDECLQKFPICVAHGVIVGGFVPLPKATCVLRDEKGLVDGSPVYERIGGNISTR